MHARREGCTSSVIVIVIGAVSVEGVLAMVIFILIICVGHITSFKSYIIRKQIM